MTSFELPCVKKVMSSSALKPRGLTEVYLAKLLLGSLFAIFQIFFGWLDITSDKWQSEIEHFKYCKSSDLGIINLFTFNIEDYSTLTESNSNGQSHILNLRKLNQCLNYTKQISYSFGIQVMEIYHHILIDTLTALAPTTLLSRWST